MRPLEIACKFQKKKLHLLRSPSEAPPRTISIVECLEHPNGDSSPAVDHASQQAISRGSSSTFHQYPVPPRARGTKPGSGFGELLGRRRKLRLANRCRKIHRSYEQSCLPSGGYCA